METSQNTFPLDIEEIKAIIPQRGNFLFIDRVVDYLIQNKETLAQGSSITATYHVPDHPIWEYDHFPGNPIMPGVLILEVANQAAAILFHLIRGGGLCTLASYELAKIKGAVVPGDNLRVHIEIIKADRRLGVASFQVVRIIGDEEKLIAEGKVYGWMLK